MLFPLLLWMATRIQPEVPAVEFRQPQLAAAQGQVALAFGGGSSIYFASSPDQGRTFGAPVKVADVGALALGRHRGPRIAILKDAIVISAIVGEAKSSNPHAHGNPENGELVAWRSADRGKTWVRAARINDVPGSAREGLHAMAADAKGNLIAAWLDLRGKGTQLYSARSTDGGRTWSKNMLVYASPEGTICQCCHPSLAVDEKGQVWAMWRNALNGNRDLYAAHSTDGEHFSEAEKLGTGSWPLNACPMDGGGLAVEHGKVISAWRRDHEVYMARPNESESLLGTGKDVALAVGAKGVYAIWVNGTSLEVKAPGADSPAKLTSEGAFPSLATLPDGSVLAAWESKGVVNTERLP